jgi:hypothetical protein
MMPFCSGVYGVNDAVFDLDPTLAVEVGWSNQFRGHARPESTTDTPHWNVSCEGLGALPAQAAVGSPAMPIRARPCRCNSA